MNRRQAARLQRQAEAQAADPLADVLSGAMHVPTMYCWKVGFGHVRITRIDEHTVTFEDKRGKVTQKTHFLFRAAATALPEEQWHGYVSRVPVKVARAAKFRQVREAA